IEGVHHPAHVVERAVIDRDPAVRRLSDARRQRVWLRRVLEGEDFAARCHRVADTLLPELDDATDNRDLVALADALQLSLAQELLNGLAFNVDGRAASLPLERCRGAPAEADDWRYHDVDGAKNGHHNRHEAR